MKLRTELWAKRYLDNKMNGTKTALELYDTKSENVAKVIASQNLTKLNFKEAIISELDQRGLTDELLDQELKRVVIQNKQLSPKISAIIEANKLKRRYPKENTEHKHLHLQLPTPEARAKRLTELLEELEGIKRLSGIERLAEGQNEPKTTRVEAREQEA